MRIKTIVSYDMDENCFILYDDDKNALIVDPGGRGEDIVSFLEEKELKTEAILLTHCHYDHVGALKQVKEKTGAKVYIGKGEEIVASSPTYNLSVYFDYALTSVYDCVLSDGEELQAGPFKVRAISTPGHTPGGCCYYIEDKAMLFSGDTLFMGSVGRSDFPGGDESLLHKNIREKLFTLPENTIVYCGHGPNTSIGYEKANNMYVGL